MKAPAPLPPQLSLQSEGSLDESIFDGYKLLQTYSVTAYLLNTNKKWMGIANGFVALYLLENINEDLTKRFKLLFVEQKKKLLDFKLTSVAKGKRKDTFVRYQNEECTVGIRFAESGVASKFHEYLLELINDLSPYAKVEKRKLQNRTSLASLDSLIENNNTETDHILEVHAGDDVISFTADSKMTLEDVRNSICSLRGLDPTTCSFANFFTTVPLPLSTPVVELQEVTLVVSVDTSVVQKDESPPTVVPVKTDKNSKPEQTKPEKKKFGLFFTKNKNDAKSKSPEPRGEVKVNCDDEIWTAFLNLANLHAVELSNPKVASLVEDFVKDRGGYSYLRQVHDQKMSPQLADDLNVLAGQIHELAEMEEKTQKTQQKKPQDLPVTTERNNNYIVRQTSLTSPTLPPSQQGVAEKTMTLDRQRKKKKQAPRPPEANRRQASLDDSSTGGYERIDDLKAEVSALKQNKPSPFGKRRAPPAPVRSTSTDSKPPPVFVPPPPPDDPPPAETPVSPVGPLSPNSSQDVDTLFRQKIDSSDTSDTESAVIMNLDQMLSEQTDETDELEEKEKDKHERGEKDVTQFSNENNSKIEDAAVSTTEVKTTQNDEESKILATSETDVTDVIVASTEQIDKLEETSSEEMSSPKLFERTSSNSENNMQARQPVASSPKEIVEQNKTIEVASPVNINQSNVDSPSSSAASLANSGESTDQQALIEQLKNQVLQQQQLLMAAGVLNGGNTAKPVTPSEEISSVPPSTTQLNETSVSTPTLTTQRNETSVSTPTLTTQRNETSVSTPTLTTQLNDSSVSKPEESSLSSTETQSIESSQQQMVSVALSSQQSSTTSPSTSSTPSTSVGDAVTLVTASPTASISSSTVTTPSPHESGGITSETKRSSNQRESIIAKKPMTGLYAKLKAKTGATNNNTIVETKPTTSETVEKSSTPSLPPLKINKSPIVATKSTSPTIATKPTSPTVAAKPISPTVAAKPISPTVATKSTSPTVATKPISPTVAAKPTSPTVATKSTTPTVVTKPVSFTPSQQLTTTTTTKTEPTIISPPIHAQHIPPPIHAQHSAAQQNVERVLPSQKTSSNPVEMNSTETDELTKKPVSPKTSQPPLVLPKPPSPSTTDIPKDTQSVSSSLQIEEKKPSDDDDDDKKNKIQSNIMMKQQDDVAVKVDSSDPLITVVKNRFENTEEDAKRSVNSTPRDELKETSVESTVVSDHVVTNTNVTNGNSEIKPRDLSHDVETQDEGVATDVIDVEEIETVSKQLQDLANEQEKKAQTNEKIETEQSKVHAAIIQPPKVEAIISRTSDNKNQTKSNPGQPIISKKTQSKIDAPKTIITVEKSPVVLRKFNPDSPVVFPDQKNSYTNTSKTVNDVRQTVDKKNYDPNSVVVFPDQKKQIVKPAFNPNSAVVFPTAQSRNHKEFNKEIIDAEKKSDVKLSSSSSKPPPSSTSQSISTTANKEQIKQQNVIKQVSTAPVVNNKPSEHLSNRSEKVKHSNESSEESLRDKLLRNIELHGIPDTTQSNTTGNVLENNNVNRPLHNKTTFMKPMERSTTTVQHSDKIKTITQTKVVNHTVNSSVPVKKEYIYDASSILNKTTTHQKSNTLPQHSATLPQHSATVQQRKPSNDVKPMKEVPVVKPKPKSGGLERTYTWSNNRGVSESPKLNNSAQTVAKTNESPEHNIRPSDVFRARSQSLKREPPKTLPKTKKMSINEQSQSETLADDGERNIRPSELFSASKTLPRQYKVPTSSTNVDLRSAAS